MQSASFISHSLHARALELASKYRHVESEFIELLQQIDSQHLFVRYGHASLYQYVVKELGLSESVAYNLITVSRKAKEVPELQNKIESGDITLSNARKIVPVLTSSNKAEWLQKASQLSQRELEKEIVRVHPKLATPERATYVNSSRMKLTLGISETDLQKLRRVQDLLCRKKGGTVSLEETIVEMTSEYLKQHDPLEKAIRHNTRAKRKPTKIVKKPVSLQVRPPIPAAIRHEINLRDQGKCTYKPPQGQPCAETRWLEIHHKKPVSKGGENQLENLVTVCSAHHTHLHSSERGT